MLIVLCGTIFLFLSLSYTFHAYTCCAHTHTQAIQSFSQEILSQGMQHVSDSSWNL